MKKHSTIGLFFVLFLGFCLISTPATAQKMETLLSGDVSHGGFGGPVVKFSSVDGSLGVWVGGRGGWIIGFSPEHSLSIGGGGYGLATNHLAPVQDNPFLRKYAEVGYGGLELEYTNRSYQIAHFTISTLIGAGGVGLRDGDYESIGNKAEAFFVMEPGLHLELNVTHFFRVATGLSYRFVSGVSRDGFKDGDFSGLNGVLTFKFGSFR